MFSYKTLGSVGLSKPPTVGNIKMAHVSSIQGSVICLPVTNAAGRSNEGFWLKKDAILFEFCWPDKQLNNIKMQQALVPSPLERV